MQYNFFVGIDISKATIDVAVLQPGTQTMHKQFSNATKGIQTMMHWLNSLPDYDVRQTVFCMEATGIYCYTLIEELQQLGAAIWVENAVQIKRSIGLTRGKNDKVDAMRIAEYAHRYIERLRLWKPLREGVDKLKHFTTLRQRLVETRTRLITPIEEMKSAGNTTMAAMLEKSIRKSLKALDADIEKIEKEMLSVIKSDNSLNKTYSLVTSVVGIGFITAVNLIVHTNEFTTINDARKLACFCGTAPFEHRSGSSIRGRTRVSNMGNKKLKSNLYMAAICAVRFDQELKGYYERKVSAGKHKLTVLNAVQCKLISRVVAVVKKQEPFLKKDQKGNLVLS